MTRIGKQEEHRNRSPRAPRPPSEKTGSKKDNLPEGFKGHPNAVEVAGDVFIAKIK